MLSFSIVFNYSSKIFNIITIFFFFFFQKNNKSIVFNFCIILISGEYINGFHLESTNVDDKCVNTNIPNCKLLSKENECKQCNDGYGVDSNFQCTECQNKDCAKCDNDYTQCIKCKDENKYLDTKTGQCVDGCANKHCLSCSHDNNDECEKCEDGYSGSKCKPCEVSNCVKCSKSVDKCEQCEDGYYAKDADYWSKTECVPFTKENCIKGDYYGYERCTKCSEGYTLNDGICEKCENDECASCYSSSGICITCKNGLFADFSQGSNSYGYCHERADSGDDKDKSKLSLGAIIGIVVGCVVVVGLVVFLVVYFLKCRKQSVEASSSE